MARLVGSARAANVLLRLSLTLSTAPPYLTKWLTIGALRVAVNTHGEVVFHAGAASGWSWSLVRRERSRSLAGGDGGCRPDLDPLCVVGRQHRPGAQVGEVDVDAGVADEGDAPAVDEVPVAGHGAAFQVKLGGPA